MLCAWPTCSDSQLEQIYQRRLDRCSDHHTGVVKTIIISKDTRRVAYLGPFPEIWPLSSTYRTHITSVCIGNQYLVQRHGQSLIKIFWIPFSQNWVPLGLGYRYWYRLSLDKYCRYNWKIADHQYGTIILKFSRLHSCHHLACVSGTKVVWILQRLTVTPKDFRRMVVGEVKKVNVLATIPQQVKFFILFNMATETQWIKQEHRFSTLKGKLLADSTAYFQHGPI